MNTLNSQIRNYIQTTIAANGSVPTRTIIDDVVRIFGCNRHKVCGIISYMVCKLESINIDVHYPNSVLYI